MMSFHRMCILLLVVFAAANTHDDGDGVGSDYDGAPFVATHEWQEIKHGQSIPQGLHVYIDVYTGERRAKLMDPESDDDLAVSLTAVAVEEDAGMEDGGTSDCSADNCDAGSVEEAKGTETSEDETDEVDIVMSDSSRKIYSALSHLPASSLGVDRDTLADLSPEEFERVLQSMWARRQKELAEAMEHIVDEAELMRNLIDNLVKTFEDDFDEKIDILSKMESFVEDMDMAYDFHTMGGFIAVIRELNSTSSDVQASAAWVIGTAVQNVREAQDWGVEDGALPKLVDALRHAGYEDEMLKRKLLYAISSLLRNNNWAKSLFEALDGTSVLLSLVSEDSATSTSSLEKCKTTTNTGHVDDVRCPPEEIRRHKKVSAKVFRLISDIMLEAQSAEAMAASPTEDNETEQTDENVPVTVMSTNKKEEQDNREIKKNKNDQRHKGPEVLAAVKGLHNELCGVKWFRITERWLHLAAAYPDPLLDNIETYVNAYESLHDLKWFCITERWSHLAAIPPQHIPNSDPTSCESIYTAANPSQQAASVLDILDTLSSTLRNVAKQDQIDHGYALELEERVSWLKALVNACI